MYLEMVISLEMEILCSHKNLCVDVCSSIIHDHQKLELTEMPLDG